MATTSRVAPFSTELNKTVAALERAVFAIGADAVVVALKGGWGEGKTTFWKRSVAVGRGDWEPGYVSVFGVESLAAIQRDVAVEALRTRPKSDAGETLQKTVEGAYPYLKAAKGVLNALAGSFGFSLDVFNVPPDVLQRFALRKGWTVCMDDIERLPDSVELDSLFGYISTLRDEYKVNVVLIYNELKVPDEKQDRLRRYAEKVIDRDVPFIPLAADIAALGLGQLSSDVTLLPELAAKCMLLDLRNIRILKRFKRYYQDVESTLTAPVDEAYLHAVANSLLLFSWVRFANLDARDLTLEFLEDYQGIWPNESKSGRNPFGDDDAKAADWRKELLREYRYLRTDELDKLLIRFVRTSVLDEAEVKSHYDGYLERRRAESATTRLTRIWQKHFHGTLRDTEPEFSDALIQALSEDMKYIPLPNIDEALVRLQQHGHDAAAQLLLKQLEREYPERIERFEASIGPLKYERLRDRVERAKKAAAVDSRSLGEVIESALSEDFVRLRDRQRLAQFEADDFVAYFMSVERDHLIGYMREIANSTRRQGGDEYDHAINKAILDAAEKIATLSPQNRSRMEAMGLIGASAPRLKPPTGTSGSAANVEPSDGSQPR